MPSVRRPLDLEVEALVTAAGFDNSESASENFLYILHDAVHVVMDEVDESHEDGLCYDATHALADTLNTLLQQPSNKEGH